MMQSLHAWKLALASELFFGTCSVSSCKQKHHWKGGHGTVLSSSRFRKWEFGN